MEPREEEVCKARLGTGAADRNGEERRSALLGRGKRAEEVGELVAEGATERLLRIEANDPGRDVVPGPLERGAAHELVRQGKAGEANAL